MINKNKGVIIYKQLVKDNHLFIKILTSNDEVIPAYIYGGNTSKKRNIYQNGYFIEFNYNNRKFSKINSISAIITEPYLYKIMENKYKSFAVLTIISILNISIYEGVIIKGIFLSISNLFHFLNNKKIWLSEYCIWMMDYLKLLGYDIDYKNNYGKNYFNLNDYKFQNNKCKNSIIFPHHIFKRNNFNYKNLIAFFEIFENIFIKNVLNNSINKMPDIYFKFKNIIISDIK